MADSEQLVQRQRARTFARSNLIFDVVLLLVVGVGDIFASGSWVFFVLIGATLLAFAGYYWALNHIDVRPATIMLAAVLELAIAVAILQSGGVLMSAVTLFSALILGVGLVLSDRMMILVVTVLSAVVYLALAALQFGGVIQPAHPGPLVDGGAPAFYKLFATALQVSLIALVGAVTASMAGGMQRRAQALEDARAEASSHASAAEKLAAELNTQLERVRATEELLRETVDQLSVPVLPLREGVVVMPLIGHIDQQRASRLTQTLLDSVYQRRSSLAIIDLTVIGDTSEVLSSMLTRMGDGARLLGAELVVAGLQPAMARMLIASGGDRLKIKSFQSLEQAIDYALAREHQAA